jgi:ATP-dependent helicase/nuclease subunit B
MVFHGLSLQLLTHLLVLEEAGEPLSRRPLVPAAALYLQLVRRMEDVDHPEDGGDPSDPKWHLKLKPRGLLDLRCLPAFDKSLTTGASDVVQVFINKDGTLGRRNYSDGAATEEFRALLDLARRRLSDIGDAVLSGRIDIAPYRLKDKSPCPRCEYHGVCRFEPSINRYRILDSIDRDTALGARPEEVGGAA